MKQIILLICMLFSLNITVLNAKPAVNNVVTSLNAFAFDLYNQVKDTRQNTILSPYSLSSLLGILVTASAGNTRAQLVKTLHLDTANNINIFNYQPDNTSLMLGNALWADNHLSYKPGFLDTLQSIKTINFFRVDFAQTDKVKAAINDWVSFRTNGNIKNMIGRIPASSKLILTNTIYFKGIWKFPFDLIKTEKHVFTQTNGNKLQVPMMNQQHDFMYTENDKLQMLQLNYDKSTLAMAILLPRPGSTLRQLQLTLNNNLFSQLQKASHTTEVIVNLPRFRIESTFNSLNSSLQALGITEAFGKKANFSNLTTQPLYISQVIQKGIIQVDEKGTVAAAATGAIVGTVMYKIKPIFTADRPFIFIIFDRQSNLILFMGHVMFPQ